VGAVIPKYAHPIVTSEQVVRFETVEKTISSGGMVVDICTKVRREGSEEKAENYLDGKALPSGISGRCDRFRRGDNSPTWCVTVWVSWWWFLRESERRGPFAWTASLDGGGRGGRGDGGRDQSYSPMLVP
jgi:hypothetical protein